MESDSINVDFHYPEASAVEVEEGIIIKAETLLKGLEGIDSIYSTSFDNYGNIHLRINSDYPMNKAMEKIRNAVDTIESYPSDAREPVISRQEQWARAILITISGPKNLLELKKITEDFRDILLNYNEISQINIWGIPSRQIVLEVSPEKLIRYKLTPDIIVAAVRNSNLNISSGSIITNQERILIRTYGKKYYTQELENISVVSKINGQKVLLREICNIREQWPENVFYSRVNGKRVVLFNVMYNNNEDVVKIAEIVEKEMKKQQKRYRGLVQFETFIRDVDELEERLGTLTQNGLIGLGLVILVLGFFLNVRLSFWVALGIPISFMGMFFIQYLLNITINEMSLFGMIMVIGILVDDGIIIGESIFAKWEREGKKSLEAAIEGTMEVIKPVTVSILTTIIAFIPYFYVYRSLGRYIWQIAAVIIICLLISLIEAAIILPVHLAHSSALQGTPNSRKKVGGLRKISFAFVFFLSDRLYRPFLIFSLRNRWSVLACILAIILVLIGAFQGTHIKSQFFPEIEAPYARINVEVPAGTTADLADKIHKKIIDKALAFGKTKANPAKDIDNAIVSYTSWLNNNELNIFLILVDNEKRDYSVNQFSEEMGEYIGSIPEAENINVKGSGNFGYPISIRFLSTDYQQLHKAKQLLKEELKKIDGVKDIQDDTPIGNKEFVVSLKPKGKALGLSLRDVTSQLRQGFYGEEIMSIQRGRDEVKIWFRFPAEYRKNISQIENLQIMTSLGQYIPFKEIATYTMQRSQTRIRHKDGYRSIKVYANLDYNKNELNVVYKELEDTVIPNVLSQVDGVSRAHGGQKEEVDKMMQSIQFTMGIAVIGIFLILMFLLKSFPQTLMTLLMIPLGFIGAIIGHFIIGIPLSFISFLGGIALGGIIVNDSVVLIDRFNNLANKMPVYDAILQAGMQRFRPIIMTTITTAAGLTPIIFEKSAGGQFLIPMAVSVVFGLLFSTFLTLLMLPSALLALHDLKLIFCRIKKSLAIG